MVVDPVNWSHRRFCDACTGSRNRTWDLCKSSIMFLNPERSLRPQHTLFLRQGL